MGDLGSGEAEQLDRNMWAPEEEEKEVTKLIIILVNIIILI